MMKKRPKNDQIWPESGIFGHFGPGLAASFGALLVGWLVVVAHELYLARHLFTLFIIIIINGGILSLTDSHHHHHGQIPTMVGICHGRSKLPGLDCDYCDHSIHNCDLIVLMR